MLINEVAVWFAAWTMSNARHEAECTTTGTGDQTARERANNFAQLRRLAHHRYQLWKREQRAQGPEVILDVTVHGTIAIKTSKQNDLSTRNIDRSRNGVPELSTIPDESKQNNGLGSSSTRQPTKAQGGETASTRDLLPVNEPSAVQDEAKRCRTEPPRNPEAILAEESQPQDQRNLQSCGHSQSHNQVDKTHLVREVTVVGTVRTANGSKVTSLLANILSAAKFTDSLSISAWVPCETPGAGGAQLSNVTFRGCEGSDLRLMPGCEFVNVKFINCKFKRTTFLDVTLSNVTFNHVDFTDATFYCLVLRSVTLFKLRFKNDVWRNLCLENALIGKNSFMLHKGTTRNYGLRPFAASSKTRQDAVIGALSPDDLKREVGHDGDWDRDIHIRFGPYSGGILTRFAMYKGTLDRIMQHCFPGSRVYIYEYPRRSKIPGESKMTQKLFWRRDCTMSTYFGSLQDGLSMKAQGSENVPRRGVGDCVALLLVNKKFSELALQHLYSRSLHLQCSAEGARAFLLAHAQQVKLVKQLVLHYHWPDDQLGLVTDRNAWRYLLGTVRHQFSLIPSIQLHIGQSFWKHNNIDRGVSHVLGSCPSADRPLFDAYKFAAPDDRWETEGDESTHRTDGTNLQIYIEDASSQTRIDFVRKMLVEIEKQRVGRPLFVLSPKGKEITYICAKKSLGN
jgi:uncharacterized protein YjbI with pentapeptide repeats